MQVAADLQELAQTIVDVASDGAPTWAKGPSNGTPTNKEKFIPKFINISERVNKCPFRSNMARLYYEKA